MSTLDGILKLLDNWPTWKRMKATPDEIDGLKQRMADLENRLQRAPGEACPKCGALEFRTDYVRPNVMMPEVGAMDRVLKCGDCGHVESRVEVPK